MTHNGSATHEQAAAHEIPPSGEEEAAHKGPAACEGAAVDENSTTYRGIATHGRGAGPNRAVNMLLSPTEDSTLVTGRSARSATPFHVCTPAAGLPMVCEAAARRPILVWFC